MTSPAHPHRSKPLSGWGHHPVETCRLYRPEKTAAFHSLATGNAEPTFIARGLGRSYGDPAMNANGGVIDLTRMNRMLAWDGENGLLTCEPGVSLAEIIDVFLPRGWFPAVTPGTKFVTVGGAIANDVHGKNHHRDGTFSQWVRELTLLLPSGETLVCSAEKNADVFWATAGGVGLTGYIIQATIQLKPRETEYVLVDYLRTKDIEQALAVMSETDRDYQYTVAWIDCLTSGKGLGRSILMRGNAASRAEATHRARRQMNLGVPFDLPSFAVSRPTVAVFNAGYYAWHSTANSVLTHYDTFFYPLDSIANWNRMYGKHGFVQYQFLLPPAGLSGMIEILQRLSKSGRASFLAVLKCMGEGNPGLLSFSGKGNTLALDLPNKPGIVEFLRELDRIVLEHGGKVYLAKDSTTTPESFAIMYPKLPEFRAIQRRLDPEGRLRSSMSRRLGLTEGAERGAP